MKKSPIHLSRTNWFLFLYILLSPLLIHKLAAGNTVHPPQYTISGTISDMNGLPLSGVNILVESTKKGTISDVDGTYKLQAGPNDILIFSIVGFKAMNVPIERRTVINVQMEEDITQLGEVVLNAGYYNVSEKERTGNIATIKAGVIDKQPVGNPLAAIQGQLSGVNIVQETGVPGGGFSIEVRGRNFINGVSDPLFIVDGVPFSSQSLGVARLSNSIVGGNISPLNAINPSDIESIEVLKDADATAIYGSRGANGLVLITTKKGKAGKTRFDAQFSTSLGQVSHFLDLMKTEEYLELRREGIRNDGVDNLLGNPGLDFFWPDVTVWDQNRYTDWQKELIGGTAYRNNAQLSVSGGSERTQFLISGAYLKESTVFPGDFKYNRANLNTSLNHRSENGKFSVSLSTSYTLEDNFLPSADFTPKAYSLEPNAPALYDSEGNINWEGNTWENPIAALEEKYGAVSNTLISNAVVSYKILDNLELKTSMGFTSYRMDSHRAMPSSARNPQFGLTPQNYSYLMTNASKRESWIVEPQLNWRKQWSKFNFDVLLGTSFQQEKTEQLALRGQGFPNNGLILNMAAAENLEVLSNLDNEYRYHALFGRINLKYLDRYIINLTGRRDGSSRFGPGKQFGNFGAIGLAWLFSEEGFVDDESPLSYGKLRASYGTTGSDNVGDYRFLDTYSVKGDDYDGVTIIEPTGLFNSFFGWEENRKIEAALELGFFKDRLLLNSSWYRNRSSNQLVGIPLAATTGFSELTGNFDAIVENTGWEFDLQTLNIQSQKFKWSTTVNLTIPKNRLVEFDGLENSTFANRYVVGKPLSIVKRYQALGVDPETGVYTFEDFNGDGNISRSEDREWLEDLAPKFYGGLGNSLSFGNLTLDAFFQFKKQKAFNTLQFGVIPGRKGNVPVDLYDRWQQPGDIAPFSRAYSGLVPTGGVDNFQQQSNAAISDASFIRLRNITLNYRIPNPKNAFEIDVYLQGQNLWTITDYKGPDPEQPTSTRLPPLRQVTLGLQLGF